MFKADSIVLSMSQHIYLMVKEELKLLQEYLYEKKKKYLLEFHCAEYSQS